jgi:IPT/TIG domain-containing protein/putative pyrroloquinoline-quinone-binding quinoprotein
MRSRGIAVAVALGLFASMGPVAGAAVRGGPSITGFSPSSGPVGTRVTIKGSGFAPPVTVQFGGVRAPGPSVNSAHTQIKVEVPPMAVSGVITVSTASGAGTRSSAPFHVTYGAALSKSWSFRHRVERVSGTAFPPNTDVIVSLDGSRFLGVGTDRNGNFTATKLIPTSLDPGPKHTMDVTCAICRALPPLRLHIFSDWPFPRYDVMGTGHNAQEWRLSPSNVGTLQFKYGDLVWAKGNVSSPLVENDGYRYVGASNGSAGLIDAVTGSGPNIGPAWFGRVDFPVTQAPMVADGVVFVVTSDMLYAFPAVRNSTNCFPEVLPFYECQPLWTALLGDAAHPFAPVVDNHEVYVATSGTGVLYAFDAQGNTNCSGTPKVCTPLWDNVLTKIYGAPVVDSTPTGGTGDVYVTAKFEGVNRIMSYAFWGGSRYKGPSIPGTTFSGPAMSSGKLVVSSWNSSTQVASLLALQQSDGSMLWQSQGLGGTAPPSTPATTNKTALVATSAGRLDAFAFASCSTSPCLPQWRTPVEGAGGSLPPVVADGVAYLAANGNGLDHAFAFSLAGTTSCSGTPTVCAPLWTSGSQTPVGIDGGITIFAGELWTSGGGSDLEATLGGAPF